MKTTIDKNQRISKVNLSSARLLAVQALYSYELTDDFTIDKVIDDFLHHGMGKVTFLNDEVSNEQEVLLAPADNSLFTIIFNGVVQNCQKIDELIVQSLSGAWTADRLEDVLQAILRAAVFELLETPELPLKIVISEYMAVADAFYSGHEPGMVNAILDKIAQQLRQQ